MKKLVLSLIVIVSFLLGNVSMIASIVKIFGMDALLPVVQDLVYNRVYKFIYGDLPRRPLHPLGATMYGSTGRQEQIRGSRSVMPEPVTGGPILKPDTRLDPLTDTDAYRKTRGILHGMPRQHLR